MAVQIWNGSSWAHAKAIPVWNGSAWVGAQSVKVWDGSSWKLAWPIASTVVVSGNQTVMSTSSANPTGRNFIASNVYTASLSNPTAVKKVEWYIYNGTTGTWGAVRQTNNYPTGNVTHTIQFSGAATAWKLRADITMLDDSVVSSNQLAINSYTKTLYATVNSHGQIGGAAAQFTASCGADCPSVQTSAAWYWWNGSSMVYHTTGNPGYWNSPDRDVDFYYRENFPDGSYIYSTVAAVRPVPLHYHYVVPAGSSRATIQTAIDNAYNWFMANKNATVNFDDEYSMACVELPANTTFTLDGTALHYRRGVRLIGAGSGASRPVLKGVSATHIFNGNNNGGGNYNAPHYDWLIQNIRFDCGNYTGGFSIAHVRRFRIKDCEFWNLGGKKHYIEINSSGGLRSDGTYNCQVYNCSFTMTNTSPSNSPRRTEDECIQMDYSWAGAASDVANDGTMANNVIISGCSFYRVPRAIGAHHYEFGTAGEADPDGITSNVLITGCSFTEVRPDVYGDGANGQNSEGAVRAYFWRKVRITGCVFTSCLQPVNFYIADQASPVRGHPGEYQVDNNTFTSSVATTRPIVNSRSVNATGRHQQCLAENNTFNGTWNTNDFAVDFQDTGTETLPASSYVVVIRNNRFEPSNLSLAEEKAYNKYSRNTDPTVYVYDNTVSDGSIDNS